MPTNLVHGTASGFQVETEFQSSRVIIAARQGIKLTPAGMVAVLGVLNTYYSGLSAGQKATLSGLCSVSSTQIAAYVVPNTEAGVGGLVQTLLGTTLVAAGNTAVG